MQLLDTPILSSSNSPQCYNLDSISSSHIQVLDVDLLSKYINFINITSHHELNGLKC